MANTGMTKEEIEEARQKRLETLRASYEMYERSKKDTKEKHKTAKDKSGNKIYSDSATKSTIQLMETMQQDIYDEYIQLGGKPEDLKKYSQKKKGVDRKVFEDIMRKETMKDEMAEYVKMMNEKNMAEPYPEDVKEDDVKEDTEMSKYAVKSIEEHETVTSIGDSGKSSQNANNASMYDLVKLPSRGIPYKHKKDKLKVAYLTAYDENMILAPGLYEDGTFLSKLLERKVLDEINVDDLIPGDRDAIVIWLRATGYGKDYPITVTDPDSGKEFKTTFDLSTIKYKEFKLKADENGYFEYTLPISKDVVKFKFLTVGDHKFLKDLRVKEDKQVAITELRSAINKIDKIINENDNIEQSIIEKVAKLSEVAYDEIVNKYNPKEDKTYSRNLTNMLTLHTISINGIKDRDYINDYIMRMNVRDASEYRKYISENEPGVEYNVKVDRPASLGGGSIDTFLQLSQFIFINLW